MTALELKENNQELTAKNQQNFQDAQVTSSQILENHKKLTAEFFHFAQKVDPELTAFKVRLPNKDSFKF
jgi:hypothetical protein